MVAIDMEMPKSCISCEMHKRRWWFGDCICGALPGEARIDLLAAKNKRPDICPLYGAKKITIVDGDDYGNMYYYYAISSDFDADNQGDAECDPASHSGQED